MVAAKKVFRNRSMDITTIGLSIGRLCSLKRSLRRGGIYGGT